MKKVMVFLGLTLLMSSSFAFSNPFQEVNCHKVAAAAWQEAIDQGASQQLAERIYSDTYLSCEQGKPVIVNN